MTHPSVDITASMTGNVLYVTLCKGWHNCWSRLVTLEQVTISDVLHGSGEFKFVSRDFRKEIWMERQKPICLFLFISLIKETTLSNAINKHNDMKCPREIVL